MELGGKTQNEVLKDYYDTDEAKGLFKSIFLVLQVCSLMHLFRIDWGFTMVFEFFSIMVV